MSDTWNISIRDGGPETNVKLNASKKSSGLRLTGGIKIKPPSLKTPQETFGQILAKIKEPEKIWLRIGKNKNSPGKLRAQRAKNFGVFRCFTRENGQKMVQKWFTNTSKFWRNFGKNKNPKFWIAGNFGKNKRTGNFWPIWTLRGGFLFLSPR